MNHLAKKQLYLAATLSIIGLAVWITISKITNEVEAWDSGLYFLIGLPIMFGAAAIAGFIVPDRPWRWGILVVSLQPIALFTQGPSSPLSAVGVFFFLVFIAIAIGCAYLGKAARPLIRQ